MDDCERLFRRLVHNTRAASPELLTRPFEVARVYQQLITYRENRTALGFASNEDYELALLQLLAGARGFIEGEPEMQHALRAELESPNPDLRAYRAFATSLVKFGGDALRDAMLRPTPEATRAVSILSPSDQAEISARPTEAVDTPDEPPVMKATAPQPVPQRPAPAQPEAPEASAPARPAPPPPSVQLPNMPVARAVPAPARRGQGCRYCGGELPDGRTVVFCPSCGHNLTVKHCAACNSELEVDWKFCITCGRSANE